MKNKLLDHVPVTKFLKYAQKCGKNKEKYCFSPFWFLIKKLDHNSGLHAKNQREIFKNEGPTYNLF